MEYSREIKSLLSDSVSSPAPLIEDPKSVIQVRALLSILYSKLFRKLVIVLSVGAFFFFFNCRVLRNRLL